jgi:quercetin dioxygenase-like cupin family protein
MTTTKTTTFPYTIDNGHGERLTFTGVTRVGGSERLEAQGVAQPGAGAPMHVHHLQEEAARVVKGRLGHQLLGGEPQFAGPGDLVVWPPGAAHRWWNAGTEELLTAGWVQPPGNIEFFLGTLFASAKENGGRPGLFDAAFLITRYRSEYAILAIPALVQRLVIPVVYALGVVLGRYGKFRDAPEPMTAERPSTKAGA